ncbi:MAG TPA: nucleotidyltransferase, partial [Candidatus Marinimicrobia bacterium]|nr:nucleotidyltransferase [Candidatus Neomarinimicrobiota bacterium]
MVKEALNNHPELKTRNTEIILQGSFKNNTNIKRDSDIDITIRLKDVFYGEYPPGYDRSQYGFTAGSYTSLEFKNTVEKALRDKFGVSEVIRGKKAFLINSNSYRVKADVVAAIEHRRYYDPPTVTNPRYHSGAEFWSDDGIRFINWPIQHHENGVKKNKDTSKSFKRCVRIFKNLRNKMTEERISSADNFPSFLI